jgi:hypothetical protein
MDLDDIAQELEKRGLTTAKKGGMRAVAYSSIRSRRDLFERMKADSYDRKSRRRQDAPAGNGK